MKDTQTHNADLISRNALLERMEKVLFATVPVEHQLYVQMAIDAFKAVAENAPAVDAEPVRSGVWVRQDETYTRYRCTVCAKGNYGGHENYCPNCGAKMYKFKENDDEVKKVFISQPMNGYSDAEILRIRSEAVTKAAVKLGPIKVIDSFFEGAPTDAKPLWYLGESLKKLSEADAVYFAKGWQNARGCRIEHEAAVAYFKEVVYE